VLIRAVLGIRVAQRVSLLVLMVAEFRKEVRSVVMMAVTMMPMVNPIVLMLIVR
jgi:hypothetical protein